MRWLALLFAPVALWIAIELYSWRKNDPTKPTVSRIFVKLFGTPIASVLTGLIAIALILHWQMVDAKWNLQRLTSGQVNIDSRLSWIKVNNANTYPRYEITDIGYQDDSQSGGNVNVYVTVLDELGRPCFGCRVDFNTTDLQNEAVQTVINGATDFPMSGDSSFDPGRGESGPYLVRVFGSPSDTVIGMGLPLRRHVVFQLRFQKVISATPPTPSPIAITPTPMVITPAPITPIPGACDILPISGVRICKP